MIGLEIIDIAYKVGIFIMLLSFTGVAGGNLYMLWKILGAFRWMEFFESRRSIQPFQVGTQVVTPSPKASEGSFVARSEEDSYISEEAAKVSSAAGISEDDAVNILLEQLRKQRENKGNVANV
jgi:hypothetical protein